MNETLLVELSGTVTRVCAECPTIFTRPADSDDTLCKSCQRKSEQKPCCDEPDHRTIGCRSHPDGTTFTKRYCRSCGKTREVES